MFPPTDSHTATPDGDPDDRVPGHTPVYSLALATYSADRLDTTGRTPDWIGRNEAEFDPTRRVLTVRGGRVLVERDGTRRFRRNVEEYELDPGTLAWRQTTDRNWPLYAIRPADGKLFVPDDCPNFEAFRPEGVPHEALPPADWNAHRLAVGGVVVTVAVGVFEVEVLVEGTLPGGLVDGLVEAARRRVEAAAKTACVAFAV